MNNDLKYMTFLVFGILAIAAGVHYIAGRSMTAKAIEENDD